MQGTYQTKQRNMILTCLAIHQEESFSAKEIYRLCQEKHNVVSLATIYRHLDYLVSMGKIKKIMSEGSKEMRFRYLEKESDKDAFFLKCDRCGKITHADCHILGKMADHMNHQHGFQIDTTKSVLYGYCKECQ